MAVNHADGMLFGSVVMYPIAAGNAAFTAGARWMTLPFFAGGLVVGISLVIASRFVLYSVLGRVVTPGMMEDKNGWQAWIIAVPLMLFYLAYPIAITCAGIYMTYNGSQWAAQALWSP
ncbi:hypothetical protein NHH03_01725 [Stieleria sp. TO1_6]|uniref:hypothetical protein n=1 Tax=Stieleria tagensis TaxID=2956795 RepID=UPI00209AFC75|nr:hypothetical protein [Stieleria tagensis]MCO8120439.1 hypothetical protein [Stieleria tagensis]